MEISEERRKIKRDQRNLTEKKRGMETSEGEKVMEILEEEKRSID